MSKRRLVKFLAELEEAELKEQILDLYARFKDVKEFYDFSFNPNEDKRVELAKIKIAKEYFPETKRKAKKRRSIAQKEISHLQQLEVSSEHIGDLMFYNLEIVQTYTAEYIINQDAFYKSMLSSFRKALVYINKNGLELDFTSRIEVITKKAFDQEWPNAEGFLIARKELLT